jgi:hypothetical protein
MKKLAKRVLIIGSLSLLALLCWAGTYTFLVMEHYATEGRIYFRMARMAGWLRQYWWEERRVPASLDDVLHCDTGLGRYVAEELKNPEGDEFALFPSEGGLTLEVSSARKLYLASLVVSMTIDTNDMEHIPRPHYKYKMSRRRDAGPKKGERVK